MPFVRSIAGGLRPFRPLPEERTQTSVHRFEAGWRCPSRGRSPGSTQRRQPYSSRQSTVFPQFSGRPGGPKFTVDADGTADSAEGGWPLGWTGSQNRRCCAATGGVLSAPADPLVALPPRRFSENTKPSGRVLRGITSGPAASLEVT